MTSLKSWTLVLQAVPCLRDGRQAYNVWLLVADCVVRGHPALRGRVNGELFYGDAGGLGGPWRILIHSRGVLGWLLLREEVLVQQRIITDAHDQARHRVAGNGGSGGLMLHIHVLCPGLHTGCLSLVVLCSVCHP